MRFNLRSYSIEYPRCILICGEMFSFKQLYDDKSDGFCEIKLEHIDKLLKCLLFSI